MPSAQPTTSIIVGESDDSSLDQVDALDSYVDKMLGDEPEDQSEDELDADESPDTGDEEDEEGEPEPIQFFEIKHQGKLYKLDADQVQELASKGFDYTQKTQELSEQRREFESHAQAQQQTFQLQQATLGIQAQLFALDSQISQFQKTDWEGWMDNDPISATKAWQKYQMARDRKTELVNEYQQHQTQIYQNTQANLSRHLEAGARVLEQEIKDWGKEVQAELKATGEEYGFSPDELAQVYDPRMVKILYDANQWRKLQKSRPELNKKMSTAKKSVKPSGRTNDPKAQTQTLMKQMKGSKDVRRREAIASKLLDKYI